MTKDISDRGNAATAPGAVPLGNIDGRWTRGTFTEAGLRTHTRGGGGVGEGEGWAAGGWGEHKGDCGPAKERQWAVV